MNAALAVCASAVICLVIAEWAESKIAKAAAKMSAATAFLAMALACGALESTYGQILLAGLVLCWIGDACLLSSGRSLAFLVGIGAFLLGHLAYAVAFHHLGIHLGALLGSALVIGGLGAFVLRWLRPHVPEDFRIPVFCYVSVISLMVAMSIGAFVAGAPGLLPVGAIVFAVSDVFVARERFVRSGFINPALGLPAYFGSQMGLAYTIHLVAVSASA